MFLFLWLPLSFLSNWVFRATVDTSITLLHIVADQNFWLRGVQLVCSFSRLSLYWISTNALLILPPNYCLRLLCFPMLILAKAVAVSIGFPTSISLSSISLSLYVTWKTHHIPHSFLISHAFIISDNNGWSPLPPLVSLSPLHLSLLSA